MSAVPNLLVYCEFGAARPLNNVIMQGHKSPGGGKLAIHPSAGISKMLFIFGCLFISHSTV